MYFCYLFLFLHPNKSFSSSFFLIPLPTPAHFPIPYQLFHYDFSSDTGKPPMDIS